jgi:hypothetical protein
MTTARSAESFYLNYRRPVQVCLDGYVDVQLDTIPSRSVPFWSQAEPTGGHRKFLSRPSPRLKYCFAAAKRQTPDDFRNFAVTDARLLVSLEVQHRNSSEIGLLRISPLHSGLATRHSCKDACQEAKKAYSAFIDDILRAAARDGAVLQEWRKVFRA